MTYDFPYGYNPYTMDPLALIAQSQQQGQPVQQPVFPQMVPEQKSFGPAHSALQDYLRASLMNQISVPGLLSAMQANPQLAQQVGGLISPSFTPQAVPHYSIDWAKAADTAKAMPTGYGS
jgi:hypothetical protein